MPSKPTASHPWAKKSPKPEPLPVYPTNFSTGPANVTPTSPPPKTDAKARSIPTSDSSVTGKAPRRK